MDEWQAAFAELSKATARLEKLTWAVGDIADQELREIEGIRPSLADIGTVTVAERYLRMDANTLAGFADRLRGHFGYLDDQRLNATGGGDGGGG